MNLFISSSGMLPLAGLNPVMRAVQALFLAAAAGTSGASFAQTADKAIRFTMPALPRIDGCMASGGLQRITTSDEPGSAMYWCGVPPQCLTVVPGGFNGTSHHCTIASYSRREPRGSATGLPGVNAVRDPQDLTCQAGALAGMQPSSGICPPSPPPPVPDPSWWDPGPGAAPSPVAIAPTPAPWYDPGPAYVAPPPPPSNGPAPVWLPDPPAPAPVPPPVPWGGQAEDPGPGVGATPGDSDGTGPGPGGGGAGGGGSDCFTAGSLVTLEDGSTKPIEQISIGDKVRSADGNDVNTVLFLERLSATHWPQLYSPDPTRFEPFATINHPLLRDGELLSPVPDLVMTNYPWFKRVSQLEGVAVRRTTEDTVYNLWLTGDATYQVNGFGTHSIAGSGGLLRKLHDCGELTYEQVIAAAHHFATVPRNRRLGAKRMNDLLEHLPMSSRGRRTMARLVMNSVNKDAVSMVTKSFRAVCSVIGSVELAVDAMREMLRQQCARAKNSPPSSAMVKINLVGLTPAMRKGREHVQ